MTATEARTAAINAQIGRRILDRVAKMENGNHGIDRAIDDVLGDGTYARLVDDLYESLRAA